MGRIYNHAFDWNASPTELFVNVVMADDEVTYFEAHSGSKTAKEDFKDLIDEWTEAPYAEGYPDRIQMIDCRGADRDRPQLVREWRRDGFETWPSNYNRSDDGNIIELDDIPL